MFQRQTLTQSSSTPDFGTTSHSYQGMTYTNLHFECVISIHKFVLNKLFKMIFKFQYSIQNTSLNITSIGMQ
jgi:hypothetical protein